MEIYQQLQETGSVEVALLAEQFTVSAMTIRRDLDLFEQQGLVTTSYGGAYLNRGTGVEPSFSLKQGHMASAKYRMAQAAAELIGDGASIILDCGTTTMEILKFIQKKKLTVITNAWAAVSPLHGNPQIKLILAPGVYDDTSAGVIHAITADFFRDYRADLSFISTQGFDPAHGATVPSAMEASVKRAILEAGEKKVLLADSSKLGHRFMTRHAQTGEFDLVISDTGATEVQKEELRKFCRKLILV
jgi:DeoR/GlpR family transcriptional regulator of sugar metabolism